MNSQTATQVAEQQLEERLQKLAQAPRITAGDVDAAIVSAQYHHFPDTTHTVCCIMLNNGHTVIGESACVYPENFDEAIGREMAFSKARDRVWEVLGYELRMHAGGSCMKLGGV